MISVIVPIYNAEKFIKETIDSLLRQSYKDFELLLIDDGSTDGSGSICIQYGQKDSRIKYYKKQNSGVSDTRNFGIEHALGKYIMFVDADDTLPVNALQTYVESQQITQADMIVAQYSYNYGGSIIPRKHRLQAGFYSYEDLKSRLLDDGTMSGILLGNVWGVLYKRDMIVANNIRFQTDVKKNEDGLFNIELVIHCKKIQIIEDNLYYYRQWKVVNKEKLKKDRNLDISNKRLIKLLQDRGELQDYRIQFFRRKVSIAFWNALQIKSSQSSYAIAKKYLYQLFAESDVRKGMKYLDYKHMNIYKKLLCIMMAKKQILLFYITVKYIVPLTERFIKR